MGQLWFVQGSLAQIDPAHWGPAKVAVYAPLKLLGLEKLPVSV
jgi:hypothetical protein